jgi:Lrp/AsnC family transcriptional regulator for asnA, asnC and gidA
VQQTDEVDERIMRLLRDDGRLSNREVARRLDISEGTVRQRLKKLEDARAIRIGVVVDPAPLGIDFVATVLLSVEPSRVELALAAFSGLAETSYVASITGSFNVFVLIAAPTMGDVQRLIDAQVDLIEAVHRIEVRPLFSAPKYDYHLVAIPQLQLN